MIYNSIKKGGMRKMWLDKLKSLKRQSGKTIDQISAESGISKGTVNKIFAGQTKDPQYTTLKAIVNCLGFTVDDLDENDPPSQDVPDLGGSVEMETFVNILKLCGIKIPENSDISDDDYRFLSAMMSAVRDWFNK